MTGLELLFANKYLLAALLAFAGGFYLYGKGYYKGKEKEKKNTEEAFQKITDEIRIAEMKNLKTEQERIANEKAVDRADDVHSLIELWNKIGPKAKDSKTDKNP